MSFRFTAVAAAMLSLFAAQAQAQSTGPSSTESSYLLPSAPGVGVTSILTTGNSVGGYTMAGIPDGLGAYDNGNGTFTVLMNHELGGTLGAVRAHGSTGAFVSQWVINKSDLSVLSGQDMIQSSANVFTGGAGGVWTAGTTSFARLCSADLAPVSAFYNAGSGVGYNGRIFLNGEENGSEGRGFAWVVGSGSTPSQVYQLQYTGRFSWENAVANPYAQDKTVMIGTDDGAGGQVYVYVGNKQNTGNAVERAGLNNGSLYAIRVNSTVQTESNASNVPFANGNGSFSLVDVSAAATGSGAALESATFAAGGSTFLRPEDSAWDPTNNARLYFATTDSFSGRSRVWRATFNDLSNPSLGGSIEVVADGVEKGFFMADNLTVDGRGHVIFQEDVGNNAHLGRVLDLDPSTGLVKVLATHDASRFVTGGANFKTQDEEASGVIDVTDMFAGVSGYDTLNNRYYLLDTQSHLASTVPGLVEGGQLQLMVVAVPEADGLAMLAGGLGVIGLVGRRRRHRQA